VATTKQHVRVQFDLEGKRRQHEQVLQALKHSPVFAKAVTLGRVQWE